MCVGNFCRNLSWNIFTTENISNQFLKQFAKSVKKVKIIEYAEHY